MDLRVIQSHLFSLQTTLNVPLRWNFGILSRLYISVSGSSLILRQERKSKLGVKVSCHRFRWKVAGIVAWWSFCQGSKLTDWNSRHLKTFRGILLGDVLTQVEHRITIEPELLKMSSVIFIWWHFEYEINGCVWFSPLLALLLNHSDLNSFQLNRFLIFPLQSIT